MIDQYIEIVFNREVVSGVFFMGLRSPGIAHSSRPGQFIMVRVNKGIDPLLRRPFSICGISDGEIICILYKIAGHGTQILAGKKAGEKLSVMGPLGQGFSLPGENEIPVLVAGGIGIAPLYFLAESLKDAPMEFMAGFGTSVDIISSDKIALGPMGISIATDDGSEGYPGMVTELLDKYIEKYIHKKNSLLIYACGPMAMLKNVSSIASHYNIPCHVSLEALMACGLGACQGCAVKIRSNDDFIHYRHVCKDGPVFLSRYIDWGNV